MDPTALSPDPAVHVLSPYALVMAADPVVQAVMLLLVAASVACWAVILDKLVRLARLRRDVRSLEAAVRSGMGVPLPGDVTGLAAAIVTSGLGESAEPVIAESGAERRDRIERAMRAAMAAGLHQVEPGLPFLATVGSTAPFVGLFGTVWGIMHSFTAIAAAQDTSLAVVAPGIAEALFATAIGLVAAIPAVIAYNRLTTDLGRLGRRLGATIGALGSRLSRLPPATAGAT